MSTDDITLGGRRPGALPLGALPADRPTVRIDCPTQRCTRPHTAPRAIGIAEAQTIAAEILSGSAGLMKVGRPGIEELAWLVIRLDPASVIDRADEMVTVDLDIDPAD